MQAFLFYFQFFFVITHANLEIQRHSITVYVPDAIKLYTRTCATRAIEKYNIAGNISLGKKITKRFRFLFLFFLVRYGYNGAHTVIMKGEKYR